MKRITIILLILVLCLPMVACGNHGRTNNAEIVQGSSVKFSEKEINSAIDAILVKFADFTGCDLKRLWYDEERSDKFIQLDLSSSGNNTIKASGAEPENIIVLFSDFKTSESSANGGFNPDSDYTDWNWILIRESKNDVWRVVDWGY